MGTSDQGKKRFSLDTSAMPGADVEEFVHEYVRSLDMGMVVSHQNRDAIRLKLDGVMLDTIAFSTGLSSSVLAQTSRDNAGTLMIARFSSDAEATAGNGVSVFLPAGSTLIASLGARMSLQHNAGRVDAIRVSTDLLSLFGAKRAEDAFVVIPAENTTVNLLFSYARLLVDEKLDEALAKLCEHHLYELLALLLRGASPHQAEAMPLVREMRLSQLKQDITANFRRQDFDVNQLAQRHGISARYIQQLFHQMGTTLTEHLNAERLDFARRQLLNPMLLRKKVADIAFESGFNDLTTFNRLFRRRFGDSPSGMRRTVARDSGSGGE